MYNIMVWRKIIFFVRDCTFKHIECSMWHLFGWAMKDSYKCSWMITLMHIMFSNTYLNVFILPWENSYVKHECAHLDVWLMKIDLTDITITWSTHSNVYMGFYIVSKYKNKMWYESFKDIWQVIWKNEDIKMQVN